MKRVVAACSTSQNPEAAFKEVADKIKKENPSPKLIIFFADWQNFYVYATRIHEEFPASTTIGSTTYISFCSDGICSSGFSAMAINDGIECSSGILFEISNFPAHFRQHVLLAADQLSSTENTCCLEFCTACSNGEELALDTFAQMLEGKNIPVIGGSSGAGLTEGNKTVVSLDGVCYVNTCVFVLIHNLKGKITFTQESFFKHTEKTFTVTDVDVEKRTVYELNGKPAADVIAGALNVPLEQLHNAMTKNPLGRVYGNKTYIAEVDKVMPDGSVSFFAQIFNNSKLVLLERSDIRAVWENTKIEAKEKLPESSFSIVINCLARSILFQNEGLLDDFVNTLKNNYGDFIGLTGYGEQLNLTHMNQTMILLQFE